MPSARRSIPAARAAVLFFIAAASVAACRKKPQAAPTPTPTVNQDSIDAERRRADSIAAAQQREQAERDRLAREQAERDRRLAEARSALTAAVFFDYDAAEIRDDARAVLEAKLPLLTANAGVRLRVAGHTDSRGSDEYNLALGQRRASAIKRWLAARGVDESRIEIVSFGEERGTCSEEDESCFSRNRRAEFEVTAGGESLTMPGGAQ
jgi:peptidoglycan-associated lipoprotein